jgi:hypothetical protein
MPKSSKQSRKSAQTHSHGIWNGRDPRELYALDPESWAVVEAHGELRAGVGLLFEEVLAPAPWDAIYVGVDPRRAFTAEKEFPGCVLKVGDGPSGGERALIDAIDLPFASKSFSGLTIGSGDHEFVELATQAAGLGLRVRVVSWSRRLSAALVGVAHEVVLLDHFLPGGPTTISSRRRTSRGASELNADFTVAA